MKYKAVIFDLDGVICSTDEYHYSAWKQLADSLGVYFDRQINNRLRGVSRMQSLEIILENYDGELTDGQKTELAEKKNETYKKLLQNMTPEDISCDVLDTLNALKANGIKIAIGSSSKNARLILQKTGLSDFFDAISDGNNITKSKPDPEVFLKAAEYLGELPENCLVVEDAFAGIDAAKAGGFTAVAIGDARAYSKTDYKIDNLKGLLQIIA